MQDIEETSIFLNIKMIEGNAAQSKPKAASKIIKIVNNEQLK